MIAAALLAVAAAGAGAAGGVAGAPPGAVNDYPTEARADYVFTCMAANGQTRTALRECACAIDHIAGILAYDDYVAAETVLAMRQTSGERTAMFRDTPFATGFVRVLQAAQAEAEILCFTPGN